MVSPIRYRSQKGLALQKERSLMYFVIFALILGVAFKWPREFGFAGAIGYLSSGPLAKLWSIAFPRAAVPEESLKVSESQSLKEEPPPAV